MIFGSLSRPFRTRKGPIVTCHTHSMLVDSGNCELGDGFRGQFLLILKAVCSARR